MNRLALLWVVLVLSGALTQGCIDHHPVASDEMDRLWTLQADTSEQASLYRPTVSGTRLPGRWIIRREDSLLRSTISIVRAADRLETDTEVIDVLVSREHAEMLSDVLVDMREAIEQLRELRTGKTDDYQGWADSMAHVLAQVESIARRTGAETDQDTPEEPVGLSAAPILEMLVLYADEQTGGQLLAELGPREAQQLRTTLGQLALRMGFALAGRELSGDLRDSLLEQLAQADNPYQVESDLAETLLAGVRSAPPAAAEDRLAAGMQTALSASSKALTVLDGFVRQWDKMDRIEAALLKDGDATLVETVISVRPGQEVRMVDVMPFQPVVAFRGTCRIVVDTDSPGDDVVVSFESDDENAGAQLRFEGIVYALARLLVIPIDSGRLRQVRVTHDSPTVGTGMTHVTVLMESIGPDKDRRRMLVYKESQEHGLSRGPLSVEYPQLRSERTFSYITPVRRYSYYSSKTGDTQIPPQSR